MSRTNLVLVLVLAAVAGAWLLARDPEREKTSGPASRFYPEFNKEAADRIVIEGGWKKQRYELGIRGGDWKLLSAGGFPVKKEEAEKFIDAVYNLRRDALTGDSEAVRKETRTDDALGRLVTVYRGDNPMASFRLGKNPKSAWQEFFVRDAGGADVYRTRTLLAEDLRSEPGAADFGSGGFDWHNYTNSLYKWCESKIWDLWDWEVVEIKLDREDLKATLTKKEEDKWEVLPEGGEPAEADADAVNAIYNPLKSLTFEEVVAPADAANLAEYGLDKNPVTVILTLRKKAEKKPEEEEKKEGEGEGEGEEKKEQEAPKTVTETRFLSVGRKVKVRKRFDDEKGEATEEDFYAILVGGDMEGGKQNFIYLVNEYKVADLRKKLEDLKVKKKEEEKEAEGCSEDEGCTEKDAEPEEPKDEDEPEQPEEPGC